MSHFKINRQKKKTNKQKKDKDYDLIKNIYRFFNDPYEIVTNRMFRQRPSLFCVSNNLLKTMMCAKQIVQRMRVREFAYD